jgi:hypothetical protein
MTTEPSATAFYATGPLPVAPASLGVPLSWKSEPMSIMHHLALLISSEGEAATYRFFPDNLADESVSGVFTVDLAKQEGEIVEESHGREKGLNWTDEETCVRLTRKIEKHFREHGEFPKSISFVG